MGLYLLDYEDLSGVVVIMKKEDCMKLLDKFRQTTDDVYVDLNVFILGNLISVARFSIFSKASASDDFEFVTVGRSIPL